MSGLLWGLGALTLALFAVLPGIDHDHSTRLLVMAGCAVVWASVSALLINWNRAPGWLIHASGSAGLIVVAVAMGSSGGAASPAWIYLFFMVVFAAIFYPRPVAWAYLLGCVVVGATPLVYDSAAWHDSFLAQLAITTPAYLLLGEAIIESRRRTQELRIRAERLADQQSALRRVATAVVDGEEPERIYALVAREIAALLHGGAAGIMRLDHHSRAIVVGSWADHPGGRYKPGTVVEVRTGSDMDRALRTARPVRIDRHAPGSAVDQLGYSASIVAPVRVADKVWGVLAVTAAQPGAFGPEDEQRLMEFGDLLATAIANLEDRAKLSAQASTDPLTGLANHRTLQQRLALEAGRAVRYSSRLSVAVIDIDHFKQINDSGGHETGDEMLVRVAECLGSLSRAEDILGRLGGDEFAWVLPDTDRQAALIAVERARREIAAATAEPYGVTVSAGICDSEVTTDPSELIHLADAALYWSKAHGRDQCSIYDPSEIDELSERQRVERLERSRALVALRALAQTVDAKDPATSHHSERVAQLAGKLARTVGWTPERAQQLSEAALVHDVGKIGISDKLLRKPSALTDSEREEIHAHSELAARIVEDVLAPEQVDWIRSHHERPDGLGYPRGLRGPEIPEGGALLAVAEAWDSMTADHSYGQGKSYQDALAECVSLTGRQFSKTAVMALMQLHSEGELADDDADSHELIGSAA